MSSNPRQGAFGLLGVFLLMFCANLLFVFGSNVPESYSQETCEGKQGTFTSQCAGTMKCTPGDRQCEQVQGKPGIKGKECHVYYIQDFKGTCCAENYCGNLQSIDGKAAESQEKFLGDTFPKPTLDQGTQSGTQGSIQSLSPSLPPTTGVETDWGTLGNTLKTASDGVDQTVYNWQQYYNNQSFPESGTGFQQTSLLQDTSSLSPNNTGAGTKQTPPPGTAQPVQNEYSYTGFDVDPNVEEQPDSNWWNVADKLDDAWQRITEGAQDLGKVISDAVDPLLLGKYAASDLSKGLASFYDKPGCGSFGLGPKGDCLGGDPLRPGDIAVKPDSGFKPNEIVTATFCGPNGCQDYSMRVHDLCDKSDCQLADVWGAQMRRQIEQDTGLNFSKKGLVNVTLAKAGSGSGSVSSGGAYSPSLESGSGNLGRLGSAYTNDPGSGSITGFSAPAGGVLYSGAFGGGNAFGSQPSVSYNNAGWYYEGYIPDGTWSYDQYQPVQQLAYAGPSEAIEYQATPSYTVADYYNNIEQGFQSAVSEVSDFLPPLSMEPILAQLNDYLGWEEYYAKSIPPGGADMEGFDYKSPTPVMNTPETYAGKLIQDLDVLAAKTPPGDLIHIRDNNCIYVSCRGEPALPPGHDRYVSFPNTREAVANVANYIPQGVQNAVDMAPGTSIAAGTVDFLPTIAPTFQSFDDTPGVELAVRHQLPESAVSSIYKDPVYSGPSYTPGPNSFQVEGLPAQEYGEGGFDWQGAYNASTFPDSDVLSYGYEPPPQSQSGISGNPPDPGFEQGILGSAPDPGFEQGTLGYEPDPGFEQRSRWQIEWYRLELGNPPDPGFEQGTAAQPSQGQAAKTAAGTWDELAVWEKAQALRNARQEYGSALFKYIDARGEAASLFDEGNTQSAIMADQKVSEAQNLWAEKRQSLEALESLARKDPAVREYQLPSSGRTLSGGTPSEGTLSGDADMFPPRSDVPPTQGPLFTADTMPDSRKGPPLQPIAGEDADTIWEFSQANNKPMPSWEKRIGDAANAGIENYTGTEEQNIKLLEYYKNEQRQIRDAIAEYNQKAASGKLLQSETLNQFQFDANDQPMPSKSYDLARGLGEQTPPTFADSGINWSKYNFSDQPIASSDSVARGSTAGSPVGSQSEQSGLNDYLRERGIDTSEAVGIDSGRQDDVKARMASYEKQTAEMIAKSQADVEQARAIMNKAQGDLEKLYKDQGQQVPARNADEAPIIQRIREREWDAKELLADSKMHQTEAQLAELALKEDFSDPRVMERYEQLSKQLSAEAKEAYQVRSDRAADRQELLLQYRAKYPSESALWDAYEASNKRLEALFGADYANVDTSKYGEVPAWYGIANRALHEIATTFPSQQSLDVAGFDNIDWDKYYDVGTDEGIMQYYRQLERPDIAIAEYQEWQTAGAELLRQQEAYQQASADGSGVSSGDSATLASNNKGDAGKYNDEIDTEGQAPQQAANSDIGQYPETPEQQQAAFEKFQQAQRDADAVQLAADNALAKAQQVQTAADDAKQALDDAKTKLAKDISSAKEDLAKTEAALKAAQKKGATEGEILRILDGVSTGKLQEIADSGALSPDQSNSVKSNINTVNSKTTGLKSENAKAQSTQTGYGAQQEWYNLKQDQRDATRMANLANQAIAAQRAAINTAEAALNSNNAYSKLAQTYNAYASQAQVLSAQAANLQISAAQAQAYASVLYAASPPLVFGGVMYWNWQAGSVLSPYSGWANSGLLAGVLQ